MEFTLEEVRQVVREVLIERKAKKKKSRKKESVAPAAKEGDWSRPAPAGKTSKKK